MRGASGFGGATRRSGRKAADRVRTQGGADKGRVGEVPEVRAAMRRRPGGARVGPVRANQVLLDLFGRLPPLVRSAVRDLSPDQLTYAPKEGVNTIAWLVWHLTRIQDDHVADARGAEQVWTDGEWAPRFGLPRGTLDTGYAHRAEQVAAVRPESWGALVEYYDAVHARTVAYLEQLTDDDLDRIVDEGWDPPVTLGVRLVSVADDDAQHVGQAAYLRGLITA
jgi:uncharacterized damage-inducible protein DinB